MERRNWGPMQWSLEEFDNGPKQIKDLLKGHPASHAAHVGNKEENEHHKTT